MTADVCQSQKRLAGPLGGSDMKVQTAPKDQVTFSAPQRRGTGCKTHTYETPLVLNADKHMLGMWSSERLPPEV